MKILAKSPKDWNIRRLGSFIEELEAGVSVNSTNDVYVDSNKVLKTSCVTGGKFNPSESKTVDPAEIHRLKCPVRNGAVVISRMNTLDLVGASALVKDDYTNLFLPDRLWQTIWKSSNPCEPGWLAQILISKPGRTFMKSIATGTSGSMKNISKESFLAAQIPTPPLAEQRKIAGILTTWDDAIEKFDALIAAKARRKQALMQQLLTGKKRVKGASGKWKKMQLGELAENQSDQNKGKMGTEYLYGVTKADGVVPMREHVKGLSFHRCKMLEHDWFAYNPMRINIGSIARWQGEKTVMVSGDYVVFRCFEDRLSAAYLDQLRKSWMWQSFVTRGGNGSVRIRIYFSDLAEFTFPCPPIEEQRQIATILDTADQEITLLRKQRNALDQQKRGLMQRLLTGKLRVNISTREVSE